MKLWLNQHAFAIHLVFSRLKHQWLNTLTICMVIGMTATLPGLMFVLLDNLHSINTHFKHNAQISVFLKNDIHANSLQRLINDTQQLPQVQSVRYVPKEQALETLSAQLSQKNLLADLPANPLPDALFITLNDTEPSTLKTIQEAMQSRDEVDELVIDSAWIARLNHLLNLGTQVAFIFAALLAATLLAVISNTVRMQVLTHEAEIEVSRLIGATHRFIRRPFLYMGCLYGLGGGMLATALLTGMLILLRQPILALTMQSESGFELGTHLYRIGGLMMLVTGIIGWLAAYRALSAQK